MSPNIRSHSWTSIAGFTLIELIVSLGIFFAMSIALIASLSTILSVRTKQKSIETSASSARTVFNTIVSAIEQATSVVASGNTLQITGNPCQTFQYYGTPDFLLKQTSVPASPSCTPLATGTQILTPASVKVNSFTLTKNVTDGSVTIVMAGTYKDIYGSHDFSYQTSAVSRVTQ